MRRRIVSVLEALSAIAGLAVLFVPDGRQWMSEHGLWGWAVGIAGIVAGVLTAEVRERRDKGQDDVAAARAAEAEAKTAAAEDLRRDAALLHERLDGWTVQGDFFRFLTQGVNLSYFPVARHDEMLRHSRAWETDPRQFRNPRLAATFDRVFKAVCAYDVAILGNMWLVERGRGVDPEFMSMANEWELEQPEKFREALHELHNGQDELAEALSELFRLMHELGIDHQPEPVAKVDQDQPA